MFLISPLVLVLRVPLGTSVVNAVAVSRMPAPYLTIGPMKCHAMAQIAMISTK